MLSPHDRDRKDALVKIEIFTNTHCTYCEQAKVLLRSKGVGFRELDVSREEVRDEFLQRLPRVRSLPQIFIKGKHIGGFEDLQHLEKSGELDKLLG